jgi:prophage regulatory protein
MNIHPPSTGRRLLSFKDLTAMGIGFSREHFWRLEAAGKFPRRLHLGPQKIAWFEDEVLAWLEQRSAERANQTYQPHD